MPSTASDLSECSVVIYMNQGPFLDNIDKSTLYDDVKGMTDIYSFEIHSSIDGFYRYGSVIIPDRVGFREVAALTGNEIITIRYMNTVTADFIPFKTIHFNIYDIEEVSYADNLRDKFTNKAIKLHLIESPIFLKYNQRVWSRHFGKDLGRDEDSKEKMTIDQVFLSHLQNDLKLNEEYIRYDFDPMITDVYWTIPFWKPQKTFSYLLQFAQDQNNYGCVKFYTTSDNDNDITVINLRSIAQMFDRQETPYSYSFVGTNAFISSAGEADGKEMSKLINQLFDYKFETYDVTSIVSGLAGAMIYNTNYSQSLKWVQTEDYESSNRKDKYFAQFGLWNPEISNYKSTMFMRTDWHTPDVQSFIQNKIVSKKYQLKCISSSYINQARNVGDRVRLDIPSGAYATNPNKDLDVQMSGDWIISDIKDYYVNGRGYSSISFIKDAFFDTVRADTGNTPERLPAVTPIAPLGGI
jgi:hypothetical protein